MHPFSQRTSRLISFNLALLALGALFFQCRLARATEAWYYKSILVGERASGLGGAFAAIADDPSGAWYNPAGLVMGQESYLSGSVNAFQSNTTRFENVFNDLDYQYKSQGLIPSFFGLTQELSPNLKFGFILMVKDYLNQEQNDRLTNLQTDTRRLTEISRQLLRTRNTYITGPAFSYQLHPRLTVGLSAFYVSQSEKYEDQQRALYINEDDASLIDYQITQTYLSRAGWGILPKLGLLYLPHPRLSIGLTAAKTFSVQGQLDAEVLQSKVANGALVPPNGDFNNDISTISLKNISSKILAPWEFSFGTAWFPNEDLTLSGQVDYYLSDPEFNYITQPTLNWSVGMEWSRIKQLPIRWGVYSNNSTTPEVSASLTDQKENVDPLGVSLGLGWVSPGSSISLSGSYQWGTGLGQILSGSTTAQTVTSQTLTIYLSGSYQL
jgi:long-subunit fatty acid transport protein